MTSSSCSVLKFDMLFQPHLRMDPNETYHLPFLLPAHQYGINASHIAFRIKGGTSSEMLKCIVAILTFCLSTNAATFMPRQLSSQPLGVYMCSGTDFGAPGGSQLGSPCDWTDLRGLVHLCLRLPPGIQSFGPDRGLRCTVVRLSHLSFTDPPY